MLEMLEGIVWNSREPIPTQVECSEDAEGGKVLCREIINEVGRQVESPEADEVGQSCLWDFPQKIIGEAQFLQRFQSFQDIQ